MTEPDSILTAAKLVAVVVLVLANGFFVAAEFSLVAVRRSRVEQLLEEKHPLAPAVQKAVQHLDSRLAATQLGITLASLGLGWIGEPALAHLIEQALGFLPQTWALAGSHALAVTIAFSIITVLHIVFGELAPKSLALQRTESTALAVARPLELFYIVLRPAIVSLNGLGNLVVRSFGLHPVGGEALVHSIEELKLLISACQEAGVVGSEVEGIAKRAFELDNLTAKQVMVPRGEVVCVAVDDSPAETMEVALEHGHTRLPVYEGTSDNVIGIVHLADVLRGQRVQPAALLRDLIRPALIVPDSVHVDDLLTRMRSHRSQMAILVDEYGGTAGLVTIHDLVERLVGQVLELRETSEDTIEPQPDGTVLIGGLTLVHDINDRFGLDIDDSAFSTVSGFVQAELGRMPVEGDVIKAGGYTFRVETLDGRRIRFLRLVGSEPRANRP